MATFLWPGDDGWPVAETDDAPDPADPTGDIDIDAVCLHAAGPHLFDDLTDLERTVLARHLGLVGPECSITQLHDDLHLSRRQVRRQLRSAVGKLRTHLAP